MSWLASSQTIMVYQLKSDHFLHIKASNEISRANEVGG
jgi:hypothetical protein